MKRLRLAIFDLTDCEGCELQFLSLREELSKLDHDFEIENWRLVAQDQNPGPYDITFIEGSPISEEDIAIVKQIRRVSEKVISLGTCATFGGVQSALPREKRSGYLKQIYGEKYASASKAPRPLGYYIDVDIELPGCPVSKDELEKLLSNLFWGKKFIPAYAPVCLDCKIKNNTCLFLEEGFCLGPVTKGGCGAVCPSAGLRCYGCFGPIPGANLKALKGANLSKDELTSEMNLFFNETGEYQAYKEGEK